jgi:hypothetical protein
LPGSNHRWIDASAQNQRHARESFLMKFRGKINQMLPLDYL